MSVFENVEIGDVTLVGTTYKNVIAKFGRYADKNLAIVLEEPSGERVAVATVNVGMPGVFIKNYSENEGLLEQLVEKGLVKEIGATVRQGFVEIPEVQLAGKFALAVNPWRDQTEFRRNQMFTRINSTSDPKKLEEIRRYIEGETDTIPEA